MKAKIKKHPHFWLVICIYAIAVVVWLVVQLGGFIANRIMFATGELETGEFTLHPSVVLDDNFVLNELAYVDDAQNTDENKAVLVTTGSDPQMIFKFGAAKVESVQLYFTYENTPQMVNVYWANNGQDYSVNNMAYAQDAQQSIFWLPATGGQSLRIDPDTRPGNMITVEKVVINAKRPFYSFFVPSAKQVLLLCVVPAFVAAVLVTLLSVLPQKNKKAGDA